MKEPDVFAWQSPHVVCKKIMVCNFTFRQSTPKIPPRISLHNEAPVVSRSGSAAFARCVVWKHRYEFLKNDFWLFVLYECAHVNTIPPLTLTLPTLHVVLPHFPAALPLFYFFIFLTNAAKLRYLWNHRVRLCASSSYQRRRRNPLKYIHGISWLSLPPIWFLGHTGGYLGWCKHIWTFGNPWSGAQLAPMLIHLVVKGFHIKSRPKRWSQIKTELSPSYKDASDIYNPVADCCERVTGHWVDTKAKEKFSSVSYSCSFYHCVHFF